MNTINGLKLFWFLCVIYCTSCLLVELAPQVNVIAGEDLNITYYFNDEVKNWYNLRIFADNVLLFEKEKYGTTVLHNTSYGDRLVITFQEYVQALLWINNMTYTDSKIMTFEYSSSPENSSIGHIKTTNTRFPVDVKGGPSICGALPSPVTYLKSRDQTTLSVFLCGHPTPEVIWKVDNRFLNGTVKEIDEETELFKYTLDFKNYLQPKKCSVKVSLMARGHSEEEQVFQSEIQYGAIISIKSLKRKMDCIFTEWTPKHVDKCSIYYEVEYRDRRNDVLWRENTTTNEAIFCSNVSASKVNSVWIRGVFLNEQNVYGDWYIHALSTNDQKKDHNILVAVSSAVGSFVVICVIVIIVISCKRKTSEPRKHQSTRFKSQSVTIKELEENENVEENNDYKDLNCLDISEETYSKLTPPKSRLHKARVQLRYSKGKIKSFKKHSTKSTHEYEVPPSLLANMSKDKTAD
uniref:Allorecognition 2 n=1 Tax=Hydractinia symbiolongicarpus TaxID=13093 RepID=C0ILU5_HYDSY|nr:unknown protein [Hydractinia symbiolongicarpus]